MDEYEIFFNRSLRFLSYRPRSIKEIRDYLKKKKVSVVTIEKIISVLLEKRFLDDLAFTQWWIDQRTRVKQKGIRIIRIELSQKGIAKEIIEQAIHETEPELQTQALEKLLQKKLRRYKGLERRELYQKLGATLMRAGYSYDVVKKSIDAALQDRV